MNFVTEVALIALALVPTTAFAGWKVTVLDKQTREVRSFLPPDESSFLVPVPMAGWGCTVFPPVTVGRDVFRKLVCSRGGAIVALHAGKLMDASLSVMHSSSDGEWLVRVFFE